LSMGKKKATLGGEDRLCTGAKGRTTERVEKRPREAAVPRTPARLVVARLRGDGREDEKTSRVGYVQTPLSGAVWQALAGSEGCPATQDRASGKHLHPESKSNANRGKPCSSVNASGGKFQKKRHLQRKNLAGKKCAPRRIGAVFVNPTGNFVRATLQPAMCQVLNKPRVEVEGVEVLTRANK
jgi:hypothetical protein